MAKLDFTGGTETHRGDAIVETRLAVDMGRDTLPRLIFIRNQLIRILTECSSGVQSWQNVCDEARQRS